MKRSWGRLGAAISAVALLAGGLVSVAAPAQAYDLSDLETTVSCGMYPYGFNEVGGQAQGWDSEPDADLGQKQCDVWDFGNPDGLTRQFSFWAFDGETADGKTKYEARGTVAVAEEEEPVGDGSVGEGCVGEESEGEESVGEESEDKECVSEESEDKEPVQKVTPPPPCWDASINNCPVGGALRFTAPKYALVGVPVTMYAYASWRPDANAPSQPTNGTAVIRVDGEDYSGVEFKDGVAEWRFIPETEGMKEFTASGVLFSGLSGANAYIDSVPARTYVLEYNPAAYAQALKKKRVEVGETYVITDPNQARSYLEDRYEWSVSDKSDDVCAVYETKKGAVKAKFNGEGRCTVIWMDKESEESGKYTFIAKK